MSLSPWVLRKINLYIGVSLFFFLMLLGCMHVFGRDLNPKVASPIEKKAETVLPFSFTCENSAYHAIGEPFLYLAKNPLKTKFPDLRSILVSYGVNCRPDSPKEESQLLISIRGTLPPTAVRIGQKVYLKYDSRPSVHRWVISENNSETPIWFEPEVMENQIVVRVKVKDGQGKLVEDPLDLSYFTLPEIALPPTNNSNYSWQIGLDTVDNTLLTKQKAKWYGRDLFLQTYGGEEYAFTNERERIEFQNEGDSYAIFAKEGDIFVYEGSGWKSVTAGPESQGKPLLQVKKVTEHVISSIVWDPEGKHKMPLDLPKSQELAQNTPAPDIKLLGARTRQDWVAEIAGKRTLLRTDDWLLWQGGKCERLTSNAQVDNYLAGTLKGELIVLAGTQKIDNELCLVGERFSESRTKSTPLRIALYKSFDTPRDAKNGPFANGKERGPNQIGREENDDEDDDDDDDDKYDPNTSYAENEEDEEEDDDDDEFI